MDRLCDDLYGLTFQLLDFSALHSLLLTSVNLHSTRMTHWFQHPTRSIWLSRWWAAQWVYYTAWVAFDLVSPNSDRVAHDPRSRSWSIIYGWMVTPARLWVDIGDGGGSGRWWSSWSFKYFYQPDYSLWWTPALVSAAPTRTSDSDWVPSRPWVPLGRTGDGWSARYGHLAVIEYLHLHGCPSNENVYPYAAEGGHLEVLKYLHDHQVGVWNPWSCVYLAACNGHLEILQYLHSNGCHWHYLNCWYVAGHDHLAVLQYLHQQGCHWASCCVSKQLVKGHLDILRYLHEHDCPWDHRARD